ncbi:MAG: S1/P1 nuclease [Lentisphaerota bacterium]
MQKILSKTSVILILALGLAALPCRVWAWGPDGHEVIGDIAEHFLTPVAKEKVQEILGSKKLGDYEISSWPDIIRGNKEYAVIYPGNGKWHYVDFDAAKHYDDQFELTLPEDGQDVVDQIQHWRKELAAANTPLERRLDALRFLVHFVGDVHQPLHCAYRYGDMGGNMIPVHSFTGKHYSFDADTPMDYAPNLHSTWDEYLVKEMMAGVKPKTFAAQLVKEITPEEIQRWRDDNVLDWAIDGYWRARKEAYHWTNGESLPVKWAHPGMDLTSENYIDSHLPVVREQLEKAGVRLALVLNTALDPDYMAPSPKESEPKE